MASERATGAPRAVEDPAGAPDATAGSTAHSRKVRGIVPLEVRAHRLLTPDEDALATATRATVQAHALLDQAHGIECALAGPLLGKLDRARGEAGEAEGREAAARSTPLDHPSVATPT